MINFIVCDDLKDFIEKIEKVIQKVMKTSNFKYKVHKFNNYDEKFIDIINDKMSFKIYILDIETPSSSGIEVARIIRQNDIESMLIFLTAFYDKYLKEILKSRFMFLDYIDKKSKTYLEDLEESIKYSLNNITKKNIVRFKAQNILYTLETKDILYISRTKDRKCNIKTSYNNNMIIVSKPLAELYDMLDDRFEYSHRACIVNKERIRKFNKKEKIIIFDDNSSIDIVSKRFSMNYE